MALLVLRRVGLCVGQNQMCHLCGGKKLFLKNVRWGKIKIQKRRPLVRLSDGSFVPLLYVYFCRSYLLCRLLGLPLTQIYPNLFNLKGSHFVLQWGKKRTFWVRNPLSMVYKSKSSKGLSIRLKYRLVTCK